MGKGQLSIPFPLIFALVGGFFFLLFFFVMIRAVIHSNTVKSTRQLSFTVETAVMTALANHNTFSKLSLQKGKYVFTCDKGPPFESYVRINDGSFENPQLFRYVPLFSPPVINGDELFISTRSWKAPFPITSLLLIANNRTRFVFVGNKPLIKNFIDRENLNNYGIDVVKTSDLGSYVDKSFDRYIFVTFNAKPGSSWPSDETFNGSSVLEVKSSDSFHSGNFTFKELNCFADPSTPCSLQPPSPTSSTINFQGGAMLDGAIFSGDEKLFECNFDKLQERALTASDILHLRLHNLTVYATNNNLSECLTLYPTAETLLSEYKSDAKDGSLSNFFGGEGVKKILTTDRELLAQDCPTLY